MVLEETLPELGLSFAYMTVPLWLSFIIWFADGVGLSSGVVVNKR